MTEEKTYYAGFRAPVRPVGRATRFFPAKPAAIFAAVAVVVSALVLGVAECRSLLDDRHPADLQDFVHNTGHGTVQKAYHHFDKRHAEMADDTSGVMADSAAAKDDGEKTGESGVPPTIVTAGLLVETAEGTTVNLPCKTAGSVDDFAVIWINGTKSIMTDGISSTADPRVKSGAPSNEDTAEGSSDHSLIIEQVSRWDSTQYSCRIMTEPNVQITHTLRVIHPAKVSAVTASGATGPLNTLGVKRVTVKEGELLQLICTADGYPEPTVQWTKKAKYQQHQAVQSPGQDLNPPSSLAQPSEPVVVSNNREVRIESVSAYRDAGVYECTAHNTDSQVAIQGTPMVTPRMTLDLDVEYRPDVVVPRRVINTGETYSAQIACSVHAVPKPQVTWEKEQIGTSDVWQLLTTDGPNSRYDARRLPSSNATNGSAVLAGPSYGLKVKQVQGPQDFGRYRCKAENKLGVSYSEPITLTGSPAQPQSSYVEVKKPAGTVSKAPELGWTVDSSSPLVEYQLQYRRQQDPSTSWADVRPQPKVVDTSAGGNTAGDERRYTVAYVFGGDQAGQAQADGSAIVPPSLQPGTTYVAHLRARNVHGWSDWSADVVFSGGIMDDDQANEINQRGGGGQTQDDGKVLKGSTAGGSSGASSGLRQQSCSAAVATAIVVLVSVAVSASVC